MRLNDYPLVVFVVTFFGLVFCSWVGATVLRRRRRLEEGNRKDFDVVLAATLTLLGLILGFSFSMAINRYDQRKNLEEEEANAIGTEMLRAELLPAADAARIKNLLKDYLAQRIEFYTIRGEEQHREINLRVARLQSELWSAVQAPAVAQPTPLSALAVAGMNDVLNSQGYSQAALWNRIPRAAWMLMVLIAVCANMLMGYGVRDYKAERKLLLILPLIVSITFMLIADIDSPRGGFIRVVPQNLMSLQDGMRGP
jgi:hypothetical protein